jgi:hypothetical protein
MTEPMEDEASHSLTQVVRLRVVGVTLASVLQSPVAVHMPRVSTMRFPMAVQATPASVAQILKVAFVGLDIPMRFPEEGEGDLHPPFASMPMGLGMEYQGPHASMQGDPHPPLMWMPMEVRMA